MKCIKCSKETKNENELCAKCLAKEELAKKKEEIALRKQEIKQVKKDLKRAKFEQISDEPYYGKLITTTGLRSSIISLSSGVAAIFFSLFILPGFIFGLLSLVEGIIAIIDVIRNNRRGHRRMLPLAFGIIGVVFSAIAMLISFAMVVSIIIFIALGIPTGLIAALIAILSAV